MSRTVCPPRFSRPTVKSLVRTMTAAAVLLIFSRPATAAPQGGSVVSGSATITSSGDTTNINQSSDKAIINWQSFSIGKPETVNFHQPGSSSVTLNRVVGNEQSVIDGVLNANGKVFLVNSAGVLIGAGASINTAGFAASTLNISNEDFAKGNYVFSGSTNGATPGDVINLGTITATGGAGGYVVLLGRTVSNQGAITATKGTVALAGGSKVTLNFGGNSLLSVSVDEGVLNALVENKQAIYADGGVVILTAKAADDLLSAQVNNTGLIQARTVDDLKGSITLYAHGGTTAVDGTLDASAPTGGDGGFVETSGDRVKIADTARILTRSATGANGNWLVDPTDFTIAASGGDMTGTYLSNYLNSQGNYTVQSSAGGGGTGGNVTVNDAITWNAANTLTISAANNIVINKAITAQYTAYSGASPSTKAGLTLTAGNNIMVNNAVSLTNAALTMTYGGDYSILTKASYAGTTIASSGYPVAQTDTSGGTYGSITFNGGTSGGDALTMNSQTYTLIRSMSDLARATGNSKYALATNLNARGTTYNSAVISTFIGTLAGLGHAVDHLTISSTATKVGLIGTASGTGTTIRDLGLTNASVTTTNTYAAPLISYISSGSVTVMNVYTEGSVSGGNYTGGLVGFNNGTLRLISDSSSATISGSGSYKGGLIGYAVGSSTISYSDATGTISGEGSLGGLAGYIYNVSLDHSYATGQVTGSSNYVGGLIGFLSIPATSSSSTLAASSITNSFAGNGVSGTAHVGGLIGGISTYSKFPTINYVTVNNAYATGNVTATATDTINSYTSSFAGGLIGEARYATISNSHATGKVTSTASTGQDVGGLVGGAYASTISNSYATGDVSAANSSNVGGLVGKMQTGAIGVGTRASDGSYASYTSLGGSISGSYATGAVTGSSNVGGLVGTLTGKEAGITGTTAPGGGLVNYVAYSNTTNSWASGKVTATSTASNAAAGGLIGSAIEGSVISSHATGAVNVAAGSVGGLIGSAFQMKITGSWANGDVSGGGLVGGLVGSANFSTITGSNAYGSGATTLSGYTDSSTTITGSTYTDQKAADAAALATQKSSARTAATSAVTASQNHSATTSASSVAAEAGVGAASLHPAVESNITVKEAGNANADIKTIEVDGTRFNLESGGNAQGSSSDGATSEDKPK